MNLYEFAWKLQDLVSPTLTRIQSQYSTSMSKMQGLTQKFQGMFRGASQSVEELRRKLDGLKGKRDLMVDTRQIKLANVAIDVLQKKLDKLQGMGVKKEDKEKNGLLSRLAPYVGAAALVTGAGSLLNSGMNREQTKVAFEQFVGKAGVDPLMGQLNRFADVTPYSNEEVYGVGRRLLSAKVGPQQLDSTMTQIGNMAAVTQKDFGDLAASYAKIKQKGFIDSGELHMEFGGTAVMDQLKKDLGVNGEQLFKMAEKRQVKFADLQTAVENLSEKGGLYEGGLEKLSSTAKGKLSTFLGTLQNKVTGWVEKLNPILGKAFDFGSDVLTKIDPLIEKLSPLFAKIWTATEPLRKLFSELWAFAGSLWTQFVGLTGGSKGLEVVFSALAAVTWVVSTAIQYAGELVMWLIEGPLGKLTLILAGVTAAFWAFNVVASLNPFGLIVTAIGLVAAGLKYAWDNIAGFREELIRVWAVGKAVFGSLGGAWEALKNGDFSGVKAALAQGWADGLANAEKTIAADKASRKIATVQAATTKPGTAGVGFPGGKAGASGDSKDVSATTGGTKSTSIVINLKSLNEGGIHINASGIQDGINDMESRLVDALLRVLNSGNSMAT